MNTHPSKHCILTVLVALVPLCAFAEPGSGADGKSPFEGLSLAEGRKPGFLAQKWTPPKRTVVWAHPGTTGDLSDPANWLENGKPLAGIEFLPVLGKNDLLAFDAETDVVLPDSPTAYKVGYADRLKGGIACRHLYVGRNATLGPSGFAAAGNVWITESGKLRTRYQSKLIGPGHVVFRNDKPRLTQEFINGRPRGGNPLQDAGYEISQYLTVEKSDGGSVEFFGTTTTSDDFQLRSGDVIVGQGAQLLPGTRSTQIVAAGSKLILLSGAEFGKVHNAPWYEADIEIAGVLMGGLPDAPLREDARLGVSFKDRDAYDPTKNKLGDLRSKPGLIFRPGSRVEVFSEGGAQLVLSWHGRESTWFAGSKLVGEKYRAMPREVDIIFGDALGLGNVRIENLGTGSAMFVDGVDRSALAAAKLVPVAGVEASAIAGPVPDELIPTLKFKK